MVLPFPDRPMDRMPVAAIREQLDTLIKSMRDEGLLDEQFSQLQMLQDASNPGFVAEVVTLFCEDTGRMLDDLTKLLEQPLIDYRTVDGYAHQMKGSSASVGAQCIRLCCIEFRRFCEQSNRDGCLHALNCVKHELDLLRNKFKTMIQNGIAKRKHRYVLDVAWTLLLNHNVPSIYWGDAVLTTCYLINRMPNSAIYEQIPWHRLTLGDKPALMPVPPIPLGQLEQKMQALDLQQPNSY